MSSRNRQVLLGLGLAVLLAAPARPQSSTGSVRGTVRDQAEAVIPGAAVKLTHSATQVSQQTKTNEVGFYVFPVVVPGPYELTVESAGLSKFQANFVVQVQQSATIDAQLRVAAEVAMVTVEATPMATVDTTSLGTVLERRRIEMMPLNGRHIASLLMLLPGMEDSTRAFGVRRGAHDYFFDGASLFDALDGAGTVTRPPGLDTIEEFKVENGSSSAKFSRLTSVILTSRSGTNSLHGSIFWTHRNNAVGKARTRTDFGPLP